MASLRRPRPMSLLKAIFLSFFLSVSLFACASAFRSSPNNSSSILATTLAKVASVVGQGDYSCGPDQPCSNRACCGPSGWCGYGDKSCGDGCQSNCDAKAECGEKTVASNRTCPLNVCCSEYGFCGTTSDFCGKGCQSNCEQPKPLAAVSNVQKRVIGYWEAWNTDHPYGTMSIGSIPVTMLTHLNIAFGYISNDGAFRVTNMDTVSPDVYRNIGKVKERNPGYITILQSANITDWEYPGATDRGGSAADGANYDSQNPIGNNVLAHTNLTEIDLAFDLFWRGNVEPSSIVLRLAFYGRSFTLENPSCWKPGCGFSGPGTTGKCTNSAGILSYREVTDILQNTGATAYLDKAAAVKYMSKIDYANRMELSNLMIWAIDLDNSGLDALRAIVDPKSLPPIDRPSSLVDLKRIFPKEYLPPKDSKISYGIINFSSLADAGETEPDKTSFGFLLVSGDSYAITQLRKREGKPKPFIFLDCPDNVINQPDDKLYSARVICLHDDVEGCFRVMEKGVEGTIMEMPNNDTVVNSPGIQYSNLQKRFFAPTTSATLHESLQVKQAKSFLKVTGQTDLTYGVGGIGSFDISRANKGNPAFNEGQRVKLGGHTVEADRAHLNGWVSFDPYYEITYQIATSKEVKKGDKEDGIASFDGSATTRTITDLGLTVFFPAPPEDMHGGWGKSRKKNEISIPDTNVLYSSPEGGGKIAIGTYIAFGLRATYYLFPPEIEKSFPVVSEITDLAVYFNTMTEFRYHPFEYNHDLEDYEEVCADYLVGTNVFPVIENAEKIGWEDVTLSNAEPDEQTIRSAKCYPNKYIKGIPRAALVAEPDSRQASWSSNTANVSITPEVNVSALATRGEIGVIELPGWGLSPKDPVGLTTFFPKPVADIYKGAQAFSCDDCLACGGPDYEEKEKKKKHCCGCVCMDLEWGLSSIEACNGCNEPDGIWPWGFGSSTALTKRNNTTTEPDSENEFHRLSERATGTATRSYKVVSVCGERFYDKGDYRYPAFSGSHSNPWEGIEFGMWDSISRYWGNTTADCENWGVTNLMNHDYRDLSGTGALLVRANYQTEHVFEGQLIGDFFEWLSKGQVRNQRPVPTNPQSLLDCDWIEEFILPIDRVNFPWQLDNRPASFMQLLLAELAMDDDEQLQAVKEMGLVFGYLNHQEIWDKFCATYEALYDLFGSFDAWYR
ncbi:chitinase [Arthroderma uncinatum]|uniref:chitinase n=1 Tax=Arthroderma uncinatum TaxID=74035 RepID=UPI00144A64C3|nr:chitinase [Arthroderma uncinatum]KAF3480712.1 chitinase [Arthroderma uncinatum]